MECKKLEKMEEWESNYPNGKEWSKTGKSEIIKENGQIHSSNDQHIDL